MPKVAIVSSDIRRANFMIGIAPDEWDVFLVDHALTDDQKAPYSKTWTPSSPSQPTFRPT